jgi:hypothetical protein
VKFLEERRYYLDRFLKKISTIDFIVNSDEMAYFSRPTGDIEKNIQRIQRLTTA